MYFFNYYWKKTMQMKKQYIGAHFAYNLCEKHNDNAKSYFLISFSTIRIKVCTLIFFKCKLDLSDIFHCDF